MPLTEKIPKLNTQKFFEQVRDFQLQICSKLDGPLKRVETESDDEWLMKLADAMSRYIQDYVEKVEITGGTIAPDTKLAPGIFDLFAGFSTMEAPIVADSDQGEFEGTLVHLLFKPGFSSNYDKIVSGSHTSIQYQGQYFLETKSVDIEPPPTEVLTKNKDHDAGELKKLQAAWSGSRTTANRNKVVNYLEEYPVKTSTPVESSTPPDTTMGELESIYLHTQDKSGTELDTNRIPLATSVEIKGSNADGMYLVEEKIPFGNYWQFKLKPGTVNGSIIQSGNMELNWEADAGTLGRIQLKEELFEVYKFELDDSATDLENIEKISEMTATAIDNFVESGDVILISDTQDIEIDKDIMVTGPIRGPADAKTTGTIPALLKGITTMGIGKAKVVDREDPFETLKTNLTTYARQFGPEGNLTSNLTIEQICNREAYGFVNSIHTYITTCLVKGEHIIPLLTFQTFGVGTKGTLINPPPVAPAPGTPSTIGTPAWPISPGTSKGDIGHGVFDGADGGFTVDEDWVNGLEEWEEIWEELALDDSPDSQSLESSIVLVKEVDGVRE
jgi:hypothetical protein